MANNLLTISMITEEALMVLENDLPFTSQVKREYSDQFAIDGAKKRVIFEASKLPGVRLWHASIN